MSRRPLIAIRARPPSSGVRRGLPALQDPRDHKVLRGRPDPQVRLGRPGRLGRSDRLDRSDPLDRPVQPERPDQLDRLDRLDRSARPGQPGHPVA